MSPDAWPLVDADGSSFAHRRRDECTALGAGRGNAVSPRHHVLKPPAAAAAAAGDAAGSADSSADADASGGTEEGGQGLAGFFDVKQVLAGLTVSLAMVPESLAFTFVAGVPPIVGLHAASIMAGGLL